MSDSATPPTDPGLATSQEAEPDQPPKWLNPVISAVIGVVVLGLFGYAIIATLGELGTAPVAANAQAGTEGYSAFDRAVQVVGLVSPVLTIILGFYFGARAGTATAAAANARAGEATRKANQHQAAAIAKDKAITYLEARIQSGSTDSAVQDVRTMHPEAFA